ncbi:MAG: GNAT family N-acetyltransferase [Ignavibacteriales bacterium]|nr:MAG: GNAT family N-acetyltransferase [Ignavibacteriales bacterium]
MKLIENEEQLDDLFERYFIKKTQTNNYLLADSYHTLIRERKLYYTDSESNCALFLQKDDFFRMYYFINNVEEILNIGMGLPVVMEIIYRGENNYPKRIIDYWLNCGFANHLTRVNMQGVYDKLELSFEEFESFTIKYAESAFEIEYAKKIIDATLDKYTGDILSIIELKQYADNNCLLIAYDGGQPAGILQFEIKHGVVWLGHICVDSDFRGKGIAKKLVSRYLKDNFTSIPSRYQLWVLNNNLPALELYRKFGFTSANKFTTSLIKR